MWTDKRDGRVFGGILAGVGLFVLLLVIWTRLQDGETNTSLLLGGFMLVLAGSVLIQKKSKKDKSDAG